MSDLHNNVGYYGTAPGYAETKKNIKQKRNQLTSREEELRAEVSRQHAAGNRNEAEYAACELAVVRTELLHLPRY